MGVFFLDQGESPLCNTWRIITEQVLKTLVDNLVDHQAVSLSAYLVVSVLGITQTLIRAHQVKMMGGLQTAPDTVW